MLEDHSPLSRNEAPPPEAMLNQDAKVWLLNLPPPLVPKNLAKSFPRIANRMAALWNEPAECMGYFDDLLFNKRVDNRQGFPPKVCLEIMRLKNHLVDMINPQREVAVPQTHNVWDTVDPRLAKDR